MQQVVIIISHSDYNFLNQYDHPGNMQYGTL